MPWLTVLARNMALNRARRLRREEPLDEAMPHGDGSAEEALLQKDRREQVQTAIRSYRNRICTTSSWVDIVNGASVVLQKYARTIFANRLEHKCQIS